MMIVMGIFDMSMRMAVMMLMKRITVAMLIGITTMVMVTVMNMQLHTAEQRTLQLYRI